MIRFEGVSKTFVDGERVIDALYDVNLHIKRGEFAFIVGRNTSGKSTLFNLIMRGIKPTTGTITVNGIDLSSLKEKQVPYYRREIGVVFQDFGLLPDMNVFDNVAYPMRVIHIRDEKEIRKRVESVLQLVGVLQNKWKASIHQLSGGEQQRVAIARAMVNNPKVLLADEPTGNIDPEMKVEIFLLLHGICSEFGTTVLLITHDHDLVKKFSGRVVVLDKGRVTRDKYFRSMEDIGAGSVGVYPAPVSASVAEKPAGRSKEALERVEYLLSELNRRYGTSA
jgi:cell division transport system ATP-binding protein